MNEKEARKAARMAEEKARAQQKAALLAKYADTFGNSPVLQSTTYRSRCYIPVPQLSTELVGRSILTRARVLTTRKKGKLAFIVLRDDGQSVQAMAAVNETVPK